MSNIKGFFKRKTLIISSLKRETLIIKAVIKSEIIILKRESFELNLYKSAGVLN